MNRDRIEGMFLGLAIGDALGMPVETFSAQKITETYGRVTSYLKPDGHKWFAGEPAGMTTDDTQLSLAVAEALIENGLCMDTHAKFHINALHESTKGWGHSTRNSIRRLANGTHWKKCAEGDSGVGNGVVMKIAPIAPLLSLGVYPYLSISDFVSSLNDMTHKTAVSAAAAQVHLNMMEECLNARSPQQFARQSFEWMEIVAAREEQNYVEADDVLSVRLKILNNCYKSLTTEQIIEQFGAGTCYCYNSLPFSYAFLLKNPESIETLYDVISAGGDTDSNGSIVGAALGALHGKSIFPDELISGLLDRERVMDVADLFCEKFGISE